MISWGSQEHGGKTSLTGEEHQLCMGLLGRTGWEGENSGFPSCERAEECM